MPAAPSVRQGSDAVLAPASSARYSGAPFSTWAVTSYSQQHAWSGYGAIQSSFSVQLTMTDRASINPHDLLLICNVSHLLV